MTETFTASYEKGILRPFRPLDLEEGQIVRLMILPPTVTSELPHEAAPVPVEKVSIEKDTTQPEEEELAAWDVASKKALELLEHIRPRKSKSEE